MDWASLTSDLRRFKWVDDSTLALAAAQPKLGLLRAEAVRTTPDPNPRPNPNPIPYPNPNPNVAHAAATAAVHQALPPPERPSPPSARASRAPPTPAPSRASPPRAPPACRPPFRRQVSCLADVSLTLLDHPLLTRNHVRDLLRKESLQPG